jgi:UDP-N-acetyl-D-mannosaminuronic acid dehydrogenase
MREETIAIVGGCGRVGLPLGLKLADKGHLVTLVDTDPVRREQVAAGHMPFNEKDAPELLGRLVSAGRLRVAAGLEGLSGQGVVVVTIGTPVDEFLDPDVRSFDAALAKVLAHMGAGQLLVLRSTVFPGVTERLGRTISELGPAVDLAYCPERLAEGVALQELSTLPQLVAGVTPQAEQRAAALFASLGVQVITLKPVEAELAKLFTNAFRYLNFAIANQFYMIAEKFGVSFQQIYRAVTTDYPRMTGFALSGFAGGPCLLKDTMQLAAFNHNAFVLGQAAMMVNEGLPSFMVERLKAGHDLRSATVGILGMAFKGNCDDARSSLSYKLRKILALECRRVLCTDPHIPDPSFSPLSLVLEESDILVLGACHEEYRGIVTTKPLLDVFYFVGRPKK